MTPHYPIQFWATREYIQEGEVIPPWYGFAYRDFDREVGVYVLFPFNWIVWLWVNHLRYKLLCPPRDKELQRVYILGIDRGYERAVNRPIIVKSDMDFKSDLPNFK